MIRSREAAVKVKESRAPRPRRPGAAPLRQGRRLRWLQLRLYFEEKLGELDEEFESTA